MQSHRDLLQHQVRVPETPRGEDESEPEAFERLFASLWAVASTVKRRPVVTTGDSWHLQAATGIAQQRPLQLTENAAATAVGLFALILMFGPISGAHFNPVVSFVDAAFGGLSWWHALAYLPAQVAGCMGGAVLANLMFSASAVSIGTTTALTPRTGCPRSSPPSA